MDQNLTKVIFRKYRNGDIIAIFPEIPGNNNVYTCSSYEHVGQHGACSPFLVVIDTKEAKPSEYKELKKELECRGYNLKIGKRLTQKDFEKRKEELNRIKNTKVA